MDRPGWLAASRGRPRSTWSTVKVVQAGLDDLRRRRNRSDLVATLGNDPLAPGSSRSRLPTGFPTAALGRPVSLPGRARMVDAQRVTDDAS